MSHPFARIGLGSASQLKIAAVKQVFPHAEILCVDAPSGVPPQPIGKEQTQQGATNRAMTVLEQLPDCDLWIGIESGMWKKEGAGGGGEEDAAFIVMLVADKTTPWGYMPHVILTEAIDIPPVAQRPFSVGPNGEWSVLKDPHQVLTGKPRQEYIEDALRTFLVQLNYLKSRQAVKMELAK